MPAGEAEEAQTSAAQTVTDSNGAASRVQRASSLKEDSFIFNDDGAAYFGADSDEESEAIPRCSMNKPQPSTMERPLSRSRRPASAPCARAAKSGDKEACHWARETLRRLRDEQVRSLEQADHGNTTSVLSKQANARLAQLQATIDDLRRKTSQEFADITGHLRKARKT
jgi:hypothetical protein